MNQTISFDGNSVPFATLSTSVPATSGYVFVCPGCLNGGPHSPGCHNQIAGSSDNVNWNFNWTCQACGQLISGGQQWHVCSTQSFPQVSTKPHCCPVCEGRGRVLFDPDRPYAARSEVQDWPCRPCNATGVLWRF